MGKTSVCSKLSKLLLAASIALTFGCNATPNSLGNQDKKSSDSKNTVNLIQLISNPQSFEDIEKIASQKFDGNSKTLFAIYMIGSDLEDDRDPENKIPDEKEKGTISTKGHGSDNIRSMLKAFTALSEEQKKSVKALVGFGGARKQGWKGIKYADLNALAKDAEDDYFGNCDCYLKTNHDANMGDGKTFREFIDATKEQAKDVDKTIVILWDHGGDYLGIGPDQNYTDNNTLSIQSMRNAFIESGFKPSMVGFDACVMGGLEVAKALDGITPYMVASEENVPGEGWDYNMAFDYLGKNPAASLSDIGKTFVDIYIDSPEHQESSGKTFAALDLRKTGAVINSVNTLVGAIGDMNTNYKTILNAASETEVFGKTNKDDQESSMDLVHFANNIKKNNKSMTSPADQVIADVKNFVIAAREDGSRPNASGISVYSIKNMESWKDKSYNKDVSFSDTWTTFVSNFIAKADNSSKPKITEEPSGESKGKLFTITDEVGISKANYFKTKKISDNLYMALGSEPLEEQENDKYLMPEWDGTVLKVSNGSQTVVVPADFKENLANNKRLYTANVKYNDFDAIFNITLDSDNKVIKHWIVPLDTDDNGKVTLSKEQYKITQDTTLQFQYETIDTANDKISNEWGDKIPFNVTPKFLNGKINETCYYFCSAQNLKGIIEVSPIKEVK